MYLIFLIISSLSTIFSESESSLNIGKSFIRCDFSDNSSLETIIGSSASFRYCIFNDLILFRFSARSSVSPNIKDVSIFEKYDSDIVRIPCFAELSDGSFADISLSLYDKNNNRIYAGRSIDLNKEVGIGKFEEGIDCFYKNYIYLDACIPVKRFNPGIRLMLHEEKLQSKSKNIVFPEDVKLPYNSTIYKDLIQIATSNIYSGRSLIVRDIFLGLTIHYKNNIRDALINIGVSGLLSVYSIDILRGTKTTVSLNAENANVGSNYIDSLKAEYSSTDCSGFTTDGVGAEWCCLYGSVLFPLGKKYNLGIEALLIGHSRMPSQIIQDNISIKKLNTVEMVIGASINFYI